MWWETHMHGGHGSGQDLTAAMDVHDNSKQNQRSCNS